ncbi:MAG: hydroxymethylglutaryl-CoA reductase [Lentinula lateritia]|nr:MAG: hydroxymethylglutaryl-CoA reductase [Lentinula lateritia]
MTRGPAIDFPSIVQAAKCRAWIDSDEGYSIVKQSFESASWFAKPRSLQCAMTGRTLFVWSATAIADAVGMNMICKGTEKAFEVMQQHFPDIITLALSGNYCTDKKPTTINWIERRGNNVVAETVIPAKVVKRHLIGNAMAGSIGGFNAHAANILTAIFLALMGTVSWTLHLRALGTDVYSRTNNGEDLLMTVSMPSIEVGTVGGGTVFNPQQAILEMLGFKGDHPTYPGQNAQTLARLIAAAVMAVELSLMSALAAGHLVRVHLKHNHSQLNTPASSTPVTPGNPLETETGDILGMEVRELGMSTLTSSVSTGTLPPYSLETP